MSTHEHTYTNQHSQHHDGHHIHRHVHEVNTSYWDNSKQHLQIVIAVFCFIIATVQTVGLLRGEIIPEDEHIIVVIGMILEWIALGTYYSASYAIGVEWEQTHRRHRYKHMEQICIWGVIITIANIILSFWSTYQQDAILFWLVAGFIFVANYFARRSKRHAYESDYRRVVEERTHNAKTMKLENTDFLDRNVENLKVK